MDSITKTGYDGLTCEVCTPRVGGLVIRHKTVTDSNSTKGHVCQFAVIVDRCVHKVSSGALSYIQGKKKDFGTIFKKLLRGVPFLNVLPLFASFRPWLHQ